MNICLGYTYIIPKKEDESKDFFWMSTNDI